MKLSPQDKALFITFGGASFLILIFFFLGVKPYQDKIPEEYFEIPVLAEALAPELEETKSRQATASQSQKVTHQLYNNRALQTESKELFEEEDIIRKAIEEQQLGSVESLNVENDALLQAHQKERELALADKREQLKAKIEAREQARNKKKENRLSTVSYDLEGRTAIRIPNPVYTCDAQGAIVIDISVNENGSITEMKYNKKASTSTNGCLIDQALEYVGSAYFDVASLTEQQGTITFNFQG
ncbi:MAG: hypothetical protein ACI828_002165 [Flavobacteriales bacterium]|jgi:hypothetical protein